MNAWVLTGVFFALVGGVVLRAAAVFKNTQRHVLFSRGLLVGGLNEAAALVLVGMGLITGFHS